MYARRNCCVKKNVSSVTRKFCLKIRAYKIFTLEIGKSAATGAAQGVSDACLRRIGFVVGIIAALPLFGYGKFPAADHLQFLILASQRGFMHKSLESILGAGVLGAEIADPGVASAAFGGI